MLWEMVLIKKQNQKNILQDLVQGIDYFSRHLRQEGKREREKKIILVL